MRPITPSSPPPGSRDVWAVAWRAVVFLPIMLGTFVFLLVHVAGLVLLPIMSVACLWVGLWNEGLVGITASLLLLASWRRFRLAEYFQDPPSLL